MRDAATFGAPRGDYASFDLASCREWAVDGMRGWSGVIYQR
jgi:hypothetical protein